MKYTILFGLLFLIGCKGEEEEMVPETLHTSSTLRHDYRLLCNQKTGEYIIFVDRYSTRYYMDTDGLPHGYSTYYPIYYPTPPENETEEEKLNRLKMGKERAIRQIRICIDFSHATIFKDSLSAMNMVRDIFDLRTEDSLVTVKHKMEEKKAADDRNHWIEGFKECK